MRGYAMVVSAAAALLLAGCADIAGGKEELELAGMKGSTTQTGRYEPIARCFYDRMGSEAPALPVNTHSEDIPARSIDMGYRITPASWLYNVRLQQVGANEVRADYAARPGYVVSISLGERGVFDRIEKTLADCGAQTAAGG